MRSLTLSVVAASTLFVASAVGQTAAERGATSGAAAGAGNISMWEKMTDAVGSVFHKVEEPGKQNDPSRVPANVHAATTSEKKLKDHSVVAGKPRPVLAAKVRGSVPTPVTTGTAHRHADSVKPAIAELTREDMAKISVGTSRQDVIARLGPPAGKMTSDEEGHLIEVFQYMARGSKVGTIRLTDGAVSAVQLPPAPIASN